MMALSGHIWDHSPKPAIQLMAVPPTRVISTSRVTTGVRADQSENLRAHKERMGRRRFVVFMGAANGCATEGPNSLGGAPTSCPRTPRPGFRRCLQVHCLRSVRGERDRLRGDRGRGREAAGGGGGRSGKPNCRSQNHNQIPVHPARSHMRLPR
jgi:hypothetical protein